MYREGEVLAGKYRVERLLGQGGMGVVVAARHVQLQERVAVKLMMTDEDNEEAVQRFVREARAAARLESDHVAHVSDVGVIDDGRAYLVMEYLDGQDLSQLLATRGRLPATEAVDYLLQACEAVAEAHSLGIVHRDLKPSNLFLTRRRDRTPHVKVLDFGISKMGTPSMAAIPITSTAALMGSPLYMSPEQMTSTKDVDARSDIWALGVVLYELLAAAAPFDGETLPQVCARVMQEAPIPLASVVPDLPAGLAAIVSRCLEKTPAARYQSLAELATALAPYGSLDSFQSVERIQRLLGAPDFLLLAPNQPLPTVAPVVAQEPAVAPNPMSAIGTQTNWGEVTIPGLKRNRLPWLVGSAAVVMLVGIGVFVQVARYRARSASVPAHAQPLAAATAPVSPPSPAPSARPTPVETKSLEPAPAPRASAAPTVKHVSLRPTPARAVTPAPAPPPAAPAPPVQSEPPPAATTRSRF